MHKYKKYSADICGVKWDGFKEYIMIIIVKWRNVTSEDSPEGIRKAYYFRNETFFPLALNDEKILKNIYENYPENAKLETRLEIKVYAEK